METPCSGLFREYLALTTFLVIGFRYPTGVGDFDVLFAIEVEPAANGAGAGAKTGGLRAHAIAGRVAVGTEAIGFLKLAVHGLRAVGYPARTVALPTEGTDHASCPLLRRAPTPS